MDFSLSSPRFWQFLTACYVGDLSLVIATLQDELINGNDKEVGASGGAGIGNMARKGHIDGCVSLAARMGHLQVVRCLLEAGLDQHNPLPQGCTAVLAAVETRDVNMLELLLETSSNFSWQASYEFYSEAVRSAVCLSRQDGTQGSGLTHAESFYNRGLSWKILRLLTRNDRLKLPQEIRDNVFYLAARFNDLELARWALQHGVIDYFKFVPGFRRHYKNPLSQAIWNDHWDMMRLILESIDAFKAAETPLEIRKRRASLRGACEDACRKDCLEPFMALAKRVHTPEDAFVKAAYIEGALAQIECLTGSVDVETEHERSGYPQPLGGYALHNAISALQVANVEYLLARGCRFQEEISVLTEPWVDAKAKAQPSLREQVISMVKSHGMVVDIRP